MLRFVGLGLSPRYITKLAAEALKTSDTVFFETYTVPVSEWTPEILAEVAGKPVKVLKRRDLEDLGGRAIFEELGKGRTVSLAVVGDPFIATTHLSLRLEALRHGYRVEIVYGVSAHCAAISASGLFPYKFGKSATIVYPRDGILSEYPYDVLKENRERGLHTLFYLDVAEDGGGMTVSEAIDILLEVEGIRRENVFTENTLVVGLARLGCEDEAIASGRAGVLKKYGSLPGPPHMLIVPGSLHFMERESLRVHSVDPES